MAEDLKKILQVPSVLGVSQFQRFRGGTPLRLHK